MDRLDKLIVSMSKASRSARVGIIGDEENASKAAWNEMGTSTAPARPFLSTAAELNEAKIVKAMDKALLSSDFASAFDSAAEALRAEVVRVIDSNVPPPLAESTIAARASRGNTSTATLVDTGAMRGAVRVEVKSGGEGWG